MSADPQVSWRFSEPSAEPSVQISPPKCAEPRAAGVSPANPASPRADMLAALSAAMTAALAAGDTEAMRVAHDAIGRLLGVPGALDAHAPTAEVVALVAERGRRADRQSVPSR